MTTRSALLLAFVLAVPALAADPAPAPAAPAAAPADAAPVDPLKEPRDLVENGANTKDVLKKALGLYEAALKDESIAKKDRVAAYADLARASVRLGDLESGTDAKVKIYEQGRAYAKLGLALDANAPEVLFWDNANQAKIGKAHGVMNSLFMVGDLKKNLARVLELSPKHLYARTTLGQIYHAIPGIAGGSDEKAVDLYTEALKIDPNFTPAMSLLAILYADRGEKDKAREWANKCITAKSSVPNDWKKFNKADAQEVLNTLN